MHPYCRSGSNLSVLTVDAQRPGRLIAMPVERVDAADFPAVFLEHRCVQGGAIGPDRVRGVVPHRAVVDFEHAADFLQVLAAIAGTALLFRVTEGQFHVEWRVEDPPRAVVARSCCVEDLAIRQVHAAGGEARVIGRRLLGLVVGPVVAAIAIAEGAPYRVSQTARDAADTIQDAAETADDPGQEAAQKAAQDAETLEHQRTEAGYHAQAYGEVQRADQTEERLGLRRIGHRRMRRVRHWLGDRQGPVDRAGPDLQIDAAVACASILRRVAGDRLSRTAAPPRHGGAYPQTDRLGDPVRPAVGEAAIVHLGAGRVGVPDRLERYRTRRQGPQQMRERIDPVPVLAGQDGLVECEPVEDGMQRPAPAPAYACRRRTTRPRRAARSWRGSRGAGRSGPRIVRRHGHRVADAATALA